MVAISMAITSLAKAAIGKPFAPLLTRSLTDFGAVGNGVADDTDALKRALYRSDQYCLDGQNRTYRVSGTLRVTNSLCLKRATLRQSLEPFDTSPYISRTCPVTGNPFIVTDCGDASVSDDDLVALRQSLALRTLFIKPAKRGDTPLLVTLDRVRIDRGPYPEAGSRQDAAGIWLEGAERVDFRDVEISGSGKGYGLLLIRSRNVTLVGLHIHDIVWSPYRGDTPLKWNEVSAIGWNTVPIREFRTAGSDGAAQSKFYGVRIQEQVTCAFLAEVTHVVIKGARISQCMARFDRGDMPWQTDGLDIGGSSTDIVVTGGTTIESTWEGMDVVASGDGIQGLTLDGVRVTNSFSFGLKLGYALQNVKVLRPVIKGAGLAAMVLYGPVKDATIADAKIVEVGGVTVSGSTLRPWASNTRAAILLDKGSAGTAAEGRAPNNIIIKGASVGAINDAGSYDLGFLNLGATNAALINEKALGCRIAISSGF